MSVEQIQVDTVGRPTPELDDAIKRLGDLAASMARYVDADECAAPYWIARWQRDVLFLIGDLVLKARAK